MVVAYITEKEFRGFVHFVIALAFLPSKNQIEAAIDDLGVTEFDQDSPHIEKITFVQR